MMLLSEPGGVTGIGAVLFLLHAAKIKTVSKTVENIEGIDFINYFYWRWFIAV